MDSLVRLRCSEQEHAKWFAAAGGKMRFSSWAREVLNVASDPDSGWEEANPSLISRLLDVELPVTTLRAAKEATPKGDINIPQGVCEKTGYDFLLCLCPICKARRG